jgi:hypothetical protein
VLGTAAGGPIDEGARRVSGAIGSVGPPTEGSDAFGVANFKSECQGKFLITSPLTLSTQGDGGFAT